MSYGCLVRCTYRTVNLCIIKKLPAEEINQ